MPVDNTEPPSFYPAGPGYDRCLAEMILLAGRSHLPRGFLDHITELPTDDLLRLLTCLVKHPDQPWGRLSNAYVGLVDGVCAGMMCLRPDLNCRDFPFFPSALADCGARIGLSPKAVEAILARQQAYLAQLPMFQEHIQEGVFLLEYLAVRPENRARGVGAGLLRRALHETAKAKGTRLDLYVDMGNDRAVNLYVHFGFRQTKAYNFNDKLAKFGPGVLRMSKDISAADLEKTRDWKEIFTTSQKGA